MIVDGVVKMREALGVTVIAEGIETQAELKRSAHGSAQRVAVPAQRARPPRPI